MVVHIEKIMNIWAKIVSAIIIPLLIFLVILGVGASIENLDKMYINILVTAFIILFYFPLIYYAWFNKPNNKNMKILAKIVTILSIGLIFLDKTFEALIFLIPVFYYAWRKKN